jgi:DNA polymerase-3 subunit gamma/tau
MFGLTAQGRLFDIAGSVIKGDAEQTLGELNQLAKQGKDLGRLVTDLLGHFRNLLVFKVSKGDLRLLEVSEAEVVSLKEQSVDITSESLTRIMEVLSECEMRLRDASSKKTLIEVALLKAIEARRMVSLDMVLQQLKSLKAGMATAPIPAPVAVEKKEAAPRQERTPAYSAPPAAPAPEPAKMQETSPEAPASTKNVDLAALWANLLDAVGRVSGFTRSYLIEAHPVSLNKSLFTIGFDPEFADHITLVDNSRNHTLISTKLAELGHHGMQVKFVTANRPEGFDAPQPVAKAPEAATPQKTAPVKLPEQKNTTQAAPASERVPQPVFNKEEFKNDALIKKALEIFKGQIIEVRS